MRAPGRRVNDGWVAKLPCLQGNPALKIEFAQKRKKDAKKRLWYLEVALKTRNFDPIIWISTATLEEDWGG